MRTTFISGGEGVGDDVIQRLFDKIDDLRGEVGELAKKVIALETTLKEREKSRYSVREVVAWLITTAIALYGVMGYRM